MEDLINQWLFDPVVERLVASGLVVLAVLVLVRYAQRALGRRIADSQRRYRLRKLVTIGGYVVTLVLLSVVYSDRLSGLTVMFGVLGAGIAFALQEVIVSIAGWIALAFGRLYDVGDRVQLGGIKGDVIDIGVLRTTLMEVGGWINGDQYNGRIVRVANGFIFKEPVYNYSSDFPFLWDEIVVPVKYGSDYEMAREGFQRVLDDITGEHARQLKGEWRKMTDKFMLEDAQLAPMVSLKMDNNWAEFALRYVVDYKKRRSTKDKICSQLLKLIEESNGRIKLGASSIEVASVPRLEVNVQKSS